jgi:hypothetical protein
MPLPGVVFSRFFGNAPHGHGLMFNAPGEICTSSYLLAFPLFIIVNECKSSEFI